jgi:hypothetical protein
VNIPVILPYAHMSKCLFSFSYEKQKYHTFGQPTGQ